VLGHATGPVSPNRRPTNRPAGPRRASSPFMVDFEARFAAGLKKRWSPEQIASRLVVDFPNDEGMRVSHETIY
jgi:IS30 family transposase